MAQRWFERAAAAVRATVSGGLDPRIVGDSYVTLGAEAERARRIAAALNAERSGAPKQPVLLSDCPFAAVTRRGPWIYVRADFARALCDDALAFVLAHEMAHHDLGHLTPMYLSAGLLGNWQQIELAADREGLRLVIEAGYSPERALRALDPQILGDEPDDPLADWFPELAAALDRVRRTHPTLEHRRDQLLSWVQARG